MSGHEHDHHHHHGHDDDHVCTCDVEHGEACCDAHSIDLSHVDKAVEKHGTKKGATIMLLQELQEQYRFLPEAALKRICALTEITPADLMGVATFYSEFRLTPMGEHSIKVCIGTACHVKGAPRVVDAFGNLLNLESGKDTDQEGQYTVQQVACMGCCTLAPVIQIDDVTYAWLTPEQVPTVLADFERQAGRKRKEAKPLMRSVPEGTEIRVCLLSCCIASGTKNVYQAILQALCDIGVGVPVKPVGCIGMCHRAPMIEIVEPGKENQIYANISPSQAADIVRKHFRPRGIARRLRDGATRMVEQLLTDAAWEPVNRFALDVRDPPVEAFKGPQRQVATEYFGELNPISLDEYRKAGGFEALERSLKEMTPEQIIEEVKESGLRGRGGGGFPTGIKWSLARQHDADVKYIVMNGDEGDPGAFMDRMIMESVPFRVIEGIIIAARAVGANEGVLYIRAEYALALPPMERAIRECEENGLLGQNILGTDFSLNLRIVKGAGAFVCGEETALIASIEGDRGMPRLRPPYPAEAGLWGKPTLVNNVETYANVPWIIRNGAKEFASVGTEQSKGTKVFALAGKINRGGLIEVPMGITLRQIVEDVAGGIAGDEKLKAVQVGGPSGGCIPENLCDTPVDYEALKELGAMMGSGGLVVLDEKDCIVDMALYFLEFTQEQSCGKCTFCRIGTRRLRETLVRICEGQGRKGDLEELEELSRLTIQGSLCGLGMSAPNPVLTTLKYFRDEYEKHLHGVCPAGKCKALISYRVQEDLCIGCTKCAQACAVEAIALTPYKPHVIDSELCTRCGICIDLCPTKAIVVEPREEAERKAAAAVPKGGVAV